MGKQHCHVSNDQAIVDNVEQLKDVGCPVPQTKLSHHQAMEIDGSMQFKLGIFCVMLCFARWNYH